MKKFLVLLVFFIFLKANGQVNDSVNEIESARKINDAMFGNIDGKVMPQFLAKSLDAKVYTSGVFKNAKATFVNLWFASCPPCIAEIPNLNRLYDVMKDSIDFQFFAITWESEKVVKEFIEKYNLHFPVLLATNEVVNQLNFGRGYPTNIIVDHEGKVRCVLSSGSLNPSPELERYFKQEIEKLLKDQYCRHTLIADDIAVQPAYDDGKRLKKRGKVSP